MSNPLEFALACIGAMWVGLCVVVGLSLIFEAAIERYVARHVDAALPVGPDLAKIRCVPSVADDAERWLRENAGP